MNKWVWEPTADSTLFACVFVGCVCVCVPKGVFGASWGPMTPLCLRLACCQSVFVMTVGLLLYKLNHSSQLFIYRPNPWQPSWHTHTHIQLQHYPLLLHCTLLPLLPENTLTSTLWKSLLLSAAWKESKTKRRLRRTGNKAREGWGYRAFDLKPLCCGWGSGGSEDTTTYANQ